MIGNVVRSLYTICLPVPCSAVAALIMPSLDINLVLQSTKLLLTADLVDTLAVVSINE